MKNQTLTNSTVITASSSETQLKGGVIARLQASPRALRRLFIRFNIKQGIKNLLFLTVGTVITALSYSLFQVPYNIAAGGISGLSIIINHFTGWPVGTLYLFMNIPLLILGFFYLGRWTFVIRTMLAVIIFSTATDLFLLYLPVGPCNCILCDENH